MTKWYVSACGAIALLTASAASAASGTTIKLFNSFISGCANRVSLTGSYRLDHMSSVHSRAEDGEIHIAGALAVPTNNGLRDVGMPCVAELMHAGDSIGSGFRQMILNAGATHQPVRLTGVWRLWSEHGAGNFVQAVSTPVASDSNPNHVFEIHPVLAIGSTSTLSTLSTMTGFTAIDSPVRTATAFRDWSLITCTLRRGPTMTTIASSAHKYNFVRMDVSINSISQLPDGIAVDANVFDWQGQHAPLAQHARLVVPAGSLAAQAIMNVVPGSGERLSLVGFPRVSLLGVIRATQNSPMFQGRLPYELVIVAAGGTGQNHFTPMNLRPPG